MAETKTNGIPDATPPRNEFKSSSLAGFGFAIGFLTALSTYAGTTSTLIALLFTLIGGSLVGWYKKDEISQEAINQIIKRANQIVIFLLLGVVAGIAFRFADRAWIEPWLSKKDPAAFVQKEDALRKQIADFKVQILEKEKTPLNKKKGTTKLDLERLAEVLEVVDRPISADLEQLLSSKFTVPRPISDVAKAKNESEKDGRSVASLQNAVLNKDRLQQLKKKLESLGKDDAKLAEQLGTLYAFIGVLIQTKEGSLDESNEAEILKTLDEKVQKAFREEIIPFLKEG